MGNHDHDASEQVASLSRRDVLVGGVAAAVMTVLPGVAEAGALYMDPRYNRAFKNAYSRYNIGKAHDTVHKNFAKRELVTWGKYQKLVLSDKNDWGNPAAYENWDDFVAETRDDLEKQHAIFSNPENWINPANPSQVAQNLRDHLDEVIRIALWDYAIPINIKVGRKRRRHHRLMTEWKSEIIPAPVPGIEPSLTINIDCPQGGWQGYTLWRNTSPTDHITSFSATWTVPPPPTADNGPQIILIFNGLESVSSADAVGGIIQPVLQWTRPTPDTPANPGGWIVRNWYIRADFDPVAFPNFPAMNAVATNYTNSSIDLNGDFVDNRTYTAGIPVKKDDIIKTVISASKDSITGKVTYTCSFTVNGNTYNNDLILTDIPEPIYAVCAVESYFVPEKLKSNMSYYPYPAALPDGTPAGSIVVSAINLQCGSNPTNPVSWIDSKVPGLDYSTSHSADKVTFTLVTPP